MPIAKKIETEAGILGIWEISETSDSLLKEYQFSSKEKEEFEKIKAEKRRIEYIASRLLVQNLLNVKNEIIYEATGKPILKNQAFNISISHSANLVAVLISKKNIGVDVELCNRNIDKVAKRFLSNEEFRTVENSNNPQIAKIIYWGAKESIFKCSDYNGVHFYKQILISPFPIGDEGIFDGKLISGTDTEYFKLWYFTFQNNMVVFCVEDKTKAM